MKLVTYLKDEKEATGILKDSGVLPLPYATMQDIIDAPRAELLAAAAAAERGEALPLGAVKLLSPIPRPRQDVICMGINYAAHAEESRRYHAKAFEKERPVTIYFSKRVNEAVPPDGDIPRHAGLVERLDYEAELAVILGKTARNVKAEDAADYIFGYTVLNDISARALQTTHKQWYFGKSLDGFTPMGPCITTADEIAFPPALKITSHVNGELRQNANTDLLINGIAEILEELTSGMTLLPGTIIATGTPAGVGMGFDPPKFLDTGDIVECTIEGIGTLRNTVK